MGQEIHENWHTMKNIEFTVSLSGWKKITEVKLNRNYLAILATLQITSYVDSRSSS